MTAQYYALMLAVAAILTTVSVATKNAQEDVVSVDSINQTLATAGSTLEALRSLNTIMGGGGVSSDKCIHTCQNGRQPQPRPGYRPTFNGCGSAEFKVDTSNLPGITSCCNQHDICYGTCNAQKSDCEERFRVCLIRACDAMRSGGKLPSEKAYETCRNLGDVFHDTVVNFGCDFYLDAQEEACTCGSDSADKKEAEAEGTNKPDKGEAESDTKSNHPRSSFLDFGAAAADEGKEL